MTTVRTITDKGAVIAWSPVKELPDFVAVGTKVSERQTAAREIELRLTRVHLQEGGGGGFEDYGGDLSIYTADLATTSSECRHLCR
jgi:hypothetical protein